MQPWINIFGSGPVSVNARLHHHQRPVSIIGDAELCLVLSGTELLCIDTLNSGLAESWQMPDLKPADSSAVSKRHLYSQKSSKAVQK